MSDSRGLSSVFLTAGGVAVETGDALEAALTERWDAGRAAWPALVVTPDVFAGHVAVHARAAGELPPAKYASDLFLACACATSAAGAIEAFEAAFGPTLRRAAAKADGSNADEIVQRVRERLFVGSPEGAAKIAEYAGRAKLASWLGAVCARVAINARRRIDDRSHDSLSDVAASEVRPDPELAILRARHAEDFKQAIRVALTRLEARDRTLLRMTLVLGHSFERVAEVYKVSRATAARWLAAARTALQAETRKELATRLRLSPSEIESLAVLIRSEINLSVATLLSESKG